MLKIIPIDIPPESPILLLSTYLHIQLKRILDKPPPHVMGPKKPSLTQQDLGSK